MKILSFDPGPTNFAYCFLDTEKRYTELSQLRSTVRGFPEDKINKFIDLFSDEMYKLLAKFEPTYVIAERFQIRDNFYQARKNCLAEVINFMLGSLATIARLREHPIETFLYPAVQWKGHMKRHYCKKGDDLSIRLLCQQNIKNSIYTDHELDAFCMCVYTVEYETDTLVLNDYSPLLNAT